MGQKRGGLLISRELNWRDLSSFGGYHDVGEKGGGSYILKGARKSGRIEKLKRGKKCKHPAKFGSFNLSKGEGKGVCRIEEVREREFFVGSLPWDGGGEK